MASSSESGLAADAEKDSALYCCMHLTKANNKILNFSEKSWVKFIECCRRWRLLNCPEALIALSFVNTEVEPCASGCENNTSPPLLPSGLKYSKLILKRKCRGNPGYHLNCYRHFCNISHIKRAENKQEKANQRRDRGGDNSGAGLSKGDVQEQPSSTTQEFAANAEDHITSLTGTHEETAKEQHGVHLSKWLLRSSISDAQVQHLPSRKHILPVHCVICGRVKYTREKLSRKRIREPLVRCANVHGGQLLKAATIRQDERLLHDIQERDLEAVEVKYHHSCYRRYTTCKLKANALSAPREYKQSFQKFYDEIIQEKLIQGKEVWPLSELNKVFIQMIKEVEGVDAKGYKSGRLKKRIQKSNPCICFCRPLHLSKSDIVFVGDLTVQNVVQDAVGQMSMVQSKRTSNPSDRGQNCSTVSEARSNMFLTATTSEATIPSAKHSLQKHPGRADYQAAIHRQSFKQDHQVHSPDGHGQEIIHDLEASRKAHLPLPDYVLDLINCSCKKTNCEPLVSGVKGGCSCRTYNVRCTDMCTCVGCGNSVPTESLKR